MEGPHYIHLHDHEGLAHHEPWITAAVDHSTQTHMASKTGPWDQEATWGGPVPDESANIIVPKSVQLVLRGEVRFKNVLLEGGSMVLDPSENVHVLCDTIQVVDGLFKAGDPSSPTGLALGKNHVIEFTGPPIDTSKDPGQFTRGLMCLNGRCLIRGRSMATPWVVLSAAPRAGDSELRVLGDVGDWLPGDLILIPDTRPTTVGREEDIFRNPQWEERRVASIPPEGGRIILDQPLSFDHPEARHRLTGEILLPATANFSRNVLFLSAEAGRTDVRRRGHTMWLGRCAVDCAHVEFRDLGRTTSADLSSTTYEEDGTPRSIGTNQKGRYSIHIHHCLGPRGGIYGAGSPQFRVHGVSSYNTEMPVAIGGPKWAGSVHNAHGGVFTWNVGMKWAGNVWIVGEHGNEYLNDYTGLYAAVCDGTRSNGQRAGDQVDFGHAGDGIWTAGPWGCKCDKWYAADCGSDGVNNYGFSNPHDLHMQLPITIGDDPYVDGQFHRREDGLRVRSHALAASTDGWRIHNCVRAVFNWGIIGYHLPITNSKFWNCPEAIVRDAYHSGIWCQDCTMIQDEGVSTRSAEQGLMGAYGLLISEPAGVFLENCDVDGFLVGASVPDLSTIRIEGGKWFCLSERLQIRPDGGVYEGRARHDIRFGNDWQTGEGVAVHKMHFVPVVRFDRTDFFTKSETYYTDARGMFRLYFPEQLKDFSPPSDMEGYRRDHWNRILTSPTTAPYRAGAPLAGAFAPAGTVELAGILSLAEQLGEPPPPIEDLTAPVISGLVIEKVTDMSAEVAWATDEPARGYVELWEAGAPEPLVVLSFEDSDLETSQSLTLTGLHPGTWYQVTVGARDAAGNTATAAVGFQTTGGDVDPPPPPNELKILGASVAVGQAGSVVSFTTTLPARGQLAYYRVTSAKPMPDTWTYLSALPDSVGRTMREESPGTDHTISLPKLPPGSYWYTAYAFQDGTQAVAVSGPHGFSVAG